MKIWIQYQAHLAKLDVVVCLKSQLWSSRQEDPWDLLSNQPGLLGQRPVSENGCILPDEGSESCSWTPVTIYTFTHMHDHREAVYLVCHSLKFLLETVCWSPWCPDWLVGTGIWVKKRAMLWSLCDSRTHHTFTLAVWKPVCSSSSIGLTYKKTSPRMTQNCLERGKTKSYKKPCAPDSVHVWLQISHGKQHTF